MFVALALHVIAAVIWVGGMFFAFMALRPVAAEVLQPPQRLPLWAGVFGRFFPWVWAAVLTLLASGYWMLLGPYGGFAQAPIYVHVMNGLGLLMTGIFLYIYFVPYPQLRQAVAALRWPEGAKALARIRVLIATNLVIGIINVLLGAGGKYFQ